MSVFTDWGGSKRLPPKNLTRMSDNNETWHSDILPKEDLIKIWIRWHTLWIVLKSAFFHRNSANFTISENTDIDIIFIHDFWSFCFFWVFKDFFNKHGYNVDVVNKIGYSRHSWKKKIIDVIILDYYVIILVLTTKFYLVTQGNL